MDTFRKSIANILRIAVDQHNLGAGLNLGHIPEWTDKGHVTRARSSDDWESLAKILFDLECLKAEIWDDENDSFNIIKDHSPFLEALREPQHYPEWRLKTEGGARKCFQAYKSYREQEQQRVVDKIKKQYNYNEPDLREICFAVSWYKSKDKTGGNKKLASIMTSKGNLRDLEGAYSNPNKWCKDDPGGFRQYLYRKRDKAKDHGFFEVVPPDYWKSYA